jgi:hypothetical protein
MAIAAACKYTKNYTIIGNEFLNDEDLSADALGVLCYLRGKPADWQVIATQLANRFKCGRERIARILKELIGCGYMEKTQARDPATNKWQAVDYLVFGRKSASLPETIEAPRPEKPVAQAGRKVALRVSRNTAFPTLLSTDLLPSTDSTKSKILVREERTIATDDDEIDLIFDDRFWPVYPKRKGQPGKQEAKKEFRKLVRSGADVGQIIASATNYAAACAAKISRKPDQARFIPMAVNWLKKDRWDDEPGELSDDGGEMTMLDLANHFRNRVKALGDHDDVWNDENGPIIDHGFFMQGEPI